LIKTFQETERLLGDARLQASAVPLRLLLPIIESSSIEDNESLQKLWAGLLATASQKTDSVSPSFVETLKQLTPDEARHLEHVYMTLLKSRNSEPTVSMPITPYAFTERWGAPKGVSADSFERLGLIRRDFDVRIKYRSRGGRQPSSVDEALDALEPEMRYQFVFTQFAISFLAACHGPLPSLGSEPRVDAKE
jgi:hypothetical protein